MHKINIANIATHILLRIMAFHFNFIPKFRKHLISDEGWINGCSHISQEI
ncbi:MAG: hypothetical protein U9P49_09280 [Thermodesulfobacteriota bacterium]|nr:hypothetical protein [Thermodesulfobacteriota bacterium]